METIERLAALLPDAADALRRHRDEAREIRLRAGRPVQVVCAGEAFVGSPVPTEALSRILSALLDHSLYAREAELAQGFFALEDGARVGVCGRLLSDGTAITGIAEVGSLCVRVSRALPGCADALLPMSLDDSGLHSLLVAGPPGMGKTTCLRELARRLSESGMRVGVADERHELAACCRGVPRLDLGPRTDVMDGGPRHLAVLRMVRAMSPQVIVTDEIGGPEDAASLAEAARCGVAIVASAHGASLEALLARPALSGILKGGAFERIALLGGAPGRLRAAYRRDHCGAWIPAEGISESQQHDTP